MKYLICLVVFIISGCTYNCHYVYTMTNNISCLQMDNRLNIGIILEKCNDGKKYFGITNVSQEKICNK